MNAAALDGAPRRFNEGVINADGRDHDIEACDTKLLREFLLKRLPRLGAQPANTLVCIVARKRCQIHASDRP